MFFRVAAMVIAAVTFAAACLAAGTHPQKLVMSEDLRPFGFPDFHKDRNVSDYTEIQFLSDNLLLVTVNVRIFAKPTEPLFSDRGLAKLLLFNLDERKLVRAVDYPVEKSAGAVQVTEDSHFAILNQEGVHVCSADLSCGPQFTTNGPVIAVANGKELLVGGNARTDRVLVDAMTLQVIKPVSRIEAAVLIAGSAYSQSLFDGAALINTLPKAPAGTIVMAKLNPKTLATRATGEAAKVVIRNLDGTVLYQVPVTRAYQTAILPDGVGNRFCIEDQGYTRLNSIVNFLDIDQGRAFNFSRIRVLDTDSGKQVFETHWDPRPAWFAPVPAYSPGGHRLALIRHSKLEVFEIP